MPPQFDSKKTTLFGKPSKLASCSPEDEIVIAGVSGAFPNSSNVREFGENLLAKKNLITQTNNKCKVGKQAILRFL